MKTAITSGYRPSVGEFLGDSRYVNRTVLGAFLAAEFIPAPGAANECCEARYING
jgi:hypothetical protein